MQLIAMAVVAALVFGACYLIDRGFAKIFRSQAQHYSGLSVRLNKRYATFGILSAALGVAAVTMGAADSAALLAGGVLLLLLGAGLITYYLSFGVFYDDDGFILTTFGKKSKTYSYGQIQAQQLYVASGNVVVELHMEDGRTVQLHGVMSGAYPFLDYAYSRWLRDTGRTEDQCSSFHDPSQSCWFPPVEG